MPEATGPSIAMVIPFLIEELGSNMKFFDDLAMNILNRLLAVYLNESALFMIVIEYRFRNIMK